MKEFRNNLVAWSVEHWKLITILMVIFTVICTAFIPLIRVDTDPENMLSSTEPVRVFHEKSKKTFDLSDILVVGVVNEKDPDGVFNPVTLKNVYNLAKSAKTLRWPDKLDPAKTAGVVEVDIIAPSEVDHIGQGEPGTVSFEWLMPQPPQTPDQAREIRDKALSNPLFQGTMISEDGKALCLYLPLTSKDLSYRVYIALNEQIAKLNAAENYHITGLPVAEDTFGVEMFIQMAISAPLAMLTIFILMLIFFRKLVLVISPMIVAMVTVLTTMGLLIGLGFPVHIMSSMIPIFLMPIAVVDSVHILSEFFERYTKEKGRKQTILEVMHTLFTSMLYTSLTSAAGFVSLALTPIPPVQVFGLFVGLGVMIAWVLTVTFIPAYVMMIPEKSLANFGRGMHHEESQSFLSLLLRRLGALTYAGAKPILAVFLVLTGVAIWGIMQIQINDNPVKWFSKKHPIRKADAALNAHFGGTYMAYLVLDAPAPKTASSGFVKNLEQGFSQAVRDLQPANPGADAIIKQTATKLAELAAGNLTEDALLEQLSAFVNQKSTDASDADFAVWDEVDAYVGIEKERLGIFKQPQMLRYLIDLQNHLEQIGLVGKSSSVADVVRKVNQELIDGKKENYRIPDSIKGVSECLMQYQSSHKPQYLWHLVTPDFLHANIWLQLKSGDNKDMEKVVRAVDAYFTDNPPPLAIRHNWAGLTYVNIVWQSKMVWGMLQSFLGSFLMVFLMMIILFRSVLWGLLSMIPLTITIVGIYGFIGIYGKDYDMPVAVLSALTLGMSVDFAIHFLERARDMHRTGQSWQQLAPEIFGEPALAIARNVLVIAIGFLPLLAAPLVPYKTVGVFICAIMGLSGAVTMFILPALMKLLEKQLFQNVSNPMPASCNCGLCLTASVSAVIVVAMNVQQFWGLNPTKMTWISLAFLPVLVLICGIASRRKACKIKNNQQQESEA